MKKMGMKKEELETALEFLNNDPWGKRILRIEYTLTLMEEGMIPKFQKLITNTSYDLREIMDDKAFDRALNKNTKGEADLIAKLNRVSDSQAIVKARYRDYALQFFLYHSGHQKDNSKLYGLAFGQIVAITYAALGIDMSGFPTEISHTQKTNYPEEPKDAKKSHN